MKIRFYKIFILILFVLIFLVSYEFIKGNIKVKFFCRDNIDHVIYYCEDDSYILNNSTCSKYITHKPLLLGDVDASGNVDLSDANIIKEYIDFKKEFTSIQLKVSDINNDEIVDMNDINLLQTNLNNSNNDIGKKYICDTDYELKDSLCLKKIEKDAKEINIKKGDINKNNKFDKNDLDLLKNYLNGKGYFTNVMLKIADVNEDEKIDNIDLQHLKRKKLKEIEIKTKKRIEEDSIKIDYDLIIDINKSSKKKILDTNTIIKYYFDVKTKKDFYYEWISISDLETYEKSACNKLNNNMEYIFNVSVKGAKNYYIMKIYEDEKCDKLVKEYKTHEYKMKSV